jgi:hypothetical protein
LPILLLSGCLRPTYRAGTIEESVRKICRKEYGFDPVARKMGKTLYVRFAIEGASLQGLDRNAAKKLNGALLTVTRVALSADVPIDFVAVQAAYGEGSVLTFLRYVPDIKAYFYNRISRGELEARGIMEIDAGDAAEAPEKWHDVSMQEFVARLSSSQLQQGLSANPLASVLSQVGRVRGKIEGGALILRVEKGESESEAGDFDALLRRAAVDKVGNALERYDGEGLLRRVRIVENKGRTLFDVSREQILAERAALPKKRSWAE